MCQKLTQLATRAAALVPAMIAAIAAGAGAVVLGPAGVLAALGPEDAVAAGIAPKGTH